MRIPRSCFPAVLALAFLVLPLSSHAQSSMCVPASNNPLVTANLCTTAPVAEILPGLENTIPGKRAQSALTLTVEQVNHMVLDAAPLIHPGDFMLFETNRRDFVLHLFLSNGKEIVTQPLTTEDAEDTSIAWRTGRIRLDYPEALNQRIVGQKLVPLHSDGTPLLIRGIKIDGRGKLIFELERTPPGQAKPAPVEPPASYPPDPHIMTASASKPDIWGRHSETGFLVPKLPPFSMHPMMFQSTGTSDPNHFKWNGKELDPETGLYNFGARYYSPALGRFVTPDPKVMSKQRMLDPQQWNMYSYSRNNPTSMFDPDGKEVRMAPNQSAQDMGAMVRTLAHSYQKKSFREKFDQLSASKHTFYLEKTNIPQPPQVPGSMVQTIIPGQNKVEALDTSKPISPDNFKDTIQFDTDKFFGSGVTETFQDFTNSHEFFHGVNIDSDVVGMQSKQEGADPQEEDNADKFGDTVKNEKPSMSLKDATKAVENALGVDKKPPQKPDKKEPQ